MEEILLSVSSPVEVELDILQLWIEGYTTEQVTSIRRNESKNQNHQGGSNANTITLLGMEFRYNYYLQHAYEFEEMIESEVLDQYRNFAALEHFLSQPLLLFKQNLYLFPSTSLIYHMIGSYYAFSSQFVRELLNKRLVKLNRKDLEDVSDSLQMNLKTITRQLNNIQQIYNTYDDINFTGNLYHFVIKNYCLSPALAKRYACIIFLLYAKFNITSKKRMQRIPCENLESCAALVLVYLCMDTGAFFKLLSAEPIADDALLLDQSNTTYWGFVWKAFLIVETFELDKELLSSLRSLRSLYSGDVLDSACLLISQQLSSLSLKRLEGSRLRNLVKSLLLLGANLSQSREYRDILEDLISKVYEPLEEVGYTAGEMGVILGCCYELVRYIPEKGTGTSMLYTTPPASVRSTTLTHEVSEQSSGGFISGKGSSGRGEQLRRDWLRFISFARLALQQLVGGEKRS